MLGPGPFPRRTSGLVRYAVVAVILLAAFYSILGSSPAALPSSSFASPKQDDGIRGGEKQPASKPAEPGAATPQSPPPPLHDTIPSPAGTGDQPGTQAPPTGAPGKDTHPIDKLIYDAQHIFAELTSKESKTLEEAAQAYRKQRGRHPPPGFDKWFEFARSKNSLVVEDFFDQIHHDIEPFWGVDPALMRRQASQFEMTINVRNGMASAGSDWFWTKIWLSMIKEIEAYLPDMDLALNAMDEPRLVVPWEDVNGYMKKAAKSAKLPKAKSVVSTFQELPLPKEGILKDEVPEIEWEKTRRFKAPRRVVDVAWLI